MELQMDNRLNKVMLIIGIILASHFIWYAGIIKNNAVLEKAEITQIVETASDCVIAKLVTIATKTENEQIKRKHLEQARYECENSHLEVLKSRASANPKAVRDKL